MRFSLMRFWFISLQRVKPLTGWDYQPECLQAGIYLLLYNLLASFPLLVGIMILGAVSFISTTINTKPSNIKPEGIPLFELL
jgi:hypothetical protein